MERRRAYRKPLIRTIKDEYTPTPEATECPKTSETDNVGPESNTQDLVGGRNYTPTDGNKAINKILHFPSIACLFIMSKILLNIGSSKEMK